MKWWRLRRNCKMHLQNVAFCKFRRASINQFWRLFSVPLFSFISKWNDTHVSTHSRTKCKLRSFEVEKHDICTTALCVRVLNESWGTYCMRDKMLHHIISNILYRNASHCIALDLIVSISKIYENRLWLTLHTSWKQRNYKQKHYRCFIDSNVCSALYTSLHLWFFIRSQNKIRFILFLFIVCTACDFCKMKISDRHTDKWRYEKKMRMLCIIFAYTTSICVKRKILNNSPKLTRFSPQTNVRSCFRNFLRVIGLQCYNRRRC